jgi:phage repressor protein C with HTH and peptisase S24 domain
MILEPYVVSGRKAWLMKEDAVALGAQPAETSVKAPSGFVSVPILAAIAALGQPIENEHERPEGPPALLLKAKVRHPRDTYALRVRGDSMYPTLQDGYLVFVDRHEDAMRPLKALDGKLVVVRLEQGTGGISIKRVQVGRNALTITADHPEAGFAPVALRLDQADRILAKVIGWWGEQ